MIHRRSYRDLVWIDSESPTKDDIRPLIEEFDIHPLVADELIGPSLKPKVDYYGNLIYCILHFPVLKNGNHAPHSQEIDFVIGKNFLITTHYDTIDPLQTFSKIFEVNSTLNRGNMGEHAGFLFYYMVKKLYRSLHDDLASIERDLKKIEDGTFQGNERAMVVEISKSARNILAVKRALALHGEVLKSLRQSARRLFDEDYDFYLSDIESEYTKVSQSLHGLSDFLAELRSTNDSLLTTKQNQIAQTLTVMAFIVLPASMVAAIFSIQVGGLPFDNDARGFWIVISIMVSVILIIFLVFKRKKWL